jgi:predicted nucleotidyltransferase
MIKLEQAKVPPDYQADLERAAQILKEAGCTKIFLFGSLAEGNLREGSDIDLAVRGCPPKEYFHVWGQLLRELQHPVDLIDLDEDNVWNQSKAELHVFASTLDSAQTS